MLWLKQLRKKKMQSALILVVIALCSLLITGSLVILTSLGKQYETLKDETNSVDVKIYPSVPVSVSGTDWLGALSDIEGVESVSEIDALTVETIILNGVKTDAFIDVCRYNDDVYSKVRVIDGSMDNLTSGRCAIPSPLAYENNIKVGDVVTVPSENGKTDFEVAAIFSETYSMSIAFTSDILVKDFGTASSSRTVYTVRLKDGYDADMLISDYTSKTDGILDGYFRSAEECIGNATITENILGGILLGISTVILAVIFVIIGFIVKSAMRADRKSIAVYKSIGYTNRRISGIYITFYETIILLGSILGAAMSTAVSSAFMRAAFRNLGIENSVSGILQKLCCVFIISAFAYVMLKIEFIKISKIRPIEILTGNEDSLGSRKLAVRKKDITSFSPAAMAMRMLRREGRKTLLVLLSCVMSVYVINISVTCLENLELISGETNYYWLGIDKHDVTIDNMVDTESFYDICQKLKSNPDIEMITRKHYNMGFAVPYHQSINCMLFEDFTDVEMDVLEGRNPANTSEVALGNACLEEFGLEIGDYIDINLDTDHRVRLLIVGSYQGFYNMGRSARLMGGVLDENDVPYDYTSASITLKDGVDKAAFIEYAEKAYGDSVKVVDRLDIYSRIMDMICDPQRSALLPFVMVTIVIGAVNLFYIIYSNNHEKRRTYTIYKSTGYSASHLMKMNLIYIAVIAAASVAIAVPALIWVFPNVMVLAMSGFGFKEYNLVISPVTTALLNAALFALFILIGIISSKDLYKNHISYIINE